MHRVITPKILYWGTPVVLVSTLNEDGSPNLAPMSSAWWLGQQAMLGMSGRSHTVRNLRRSPQCVLNLPSASLVDAVDRLALTTGSDPVPEYMAAMGYRHERDKFAVAGLTPKPSERVAPPRVAECTVQMEAEVVAFHAIGPADGTLVVMEARILRVHADPRILVPGTDGYVDPDRWRPLIMSFCEFYGLGGRVHPSRLGEVYGPPAEAAAA
jgi:flavin reductase (DIM6/NTAB) family NADH-FMN oxidoreductase RutF